MGPAVRGLLERYNLSSSKVLASGPHGLLLKGDVLNHIEKEHLKPVSRNPPYIIITFHNLFLKFALYSRTATSTFIARYW